MKTLSPLIRVMEINKPNLDLTGSRAECLKTLLFENLKDVNIGWSNEDVFGHLLHHMKGW